MDVQERICGLLTEALRLLDINGAVMAAIHVSHALETLGCPINDPEFRAVPKE